MDITRNHYLKKEYVDKLMAVCDDIRYNFEKEHQMALGESKHNDPKNNESFDDFLDDIIEKFSLKLKANA